MLFNQRKVCLLLLVLFSHASLATAVNAKKDDIAALAKEWAISGEPQLPVPSTPGEVSGRIINGNDAPPFRYEYAVSIQNGLFHFCGGSLIGK